ncbi:MAG: PQQ-binding-like beta-propeller repeat protein [Planctomycetaceae bacterium]
MSGNSDSPNRRLSRALHCAGRIGDPSHERGGHSRIRIFRHGFLRGSFVIAAAFVALTIGGREVVSQENDAANATQRDSNLEASLRQALDDVEAWEREGGGILLLGADRHGARRHIAAIEVAAGEPAAVEPRSADAGPGLLVAADRRMVLRLRRAEEYLADGKHAEAAEFAQLILDAAEDGFFHPDPDKPETYRSLKSAATELIGRIPPAELKEAYEGPYGGEARRLLDQAAKKGDFPAVADVSRRYFHTAAGYEATWRIGTQRFDRGNFLAAALAFERLRTVPRARAPREPYLSLRTALCWSRAGMNDRAAEVLEELPVREDARVHVGGRDIPLFAPDDDKPAWLARHFGGAASRGGPARGDWPVFRGDAARIGVAAFDPAAAAGNDVRQREWRQSAVVDPDKVYDDPGETEREARLRSMIPVARTDTDALPVRQPIAADGLVFARTLGTVRAMRLDTGETVWESMVDSTLSELLRADEEVEKKDEEGDTGPYAFLTAAQRDVLVARLLDERNWKDALHGTLGSDGERLYVIEEIAFATPIVLPNERGAPTIQSPSPFNRLTAFDVSTGRTNWKIGGAPTDDDGYVRPLAGRFFLGPPLPLAGTLYVLAESAGAVRLLALDAVTGSLEWEQPIAEPDFDISSSPPRRMAGNAPSYADGVLVCPTGTGGLVALELDTRSLLWAYQVADGEVAPNQPFPRPRPRPAPVPVSTPQTWNEPVPLIADRRVLFVPPTGDALHCVGLLDGVPRWKHPRGDAVAIAGVSGGRVFLVGTNGVRAVRLEDGGSVWEKPAPFSSGKPAGRGFLTDERLYVPLTTSKIAVFDLATGRALPPLEFPADADPGNLLGTRGAIVTQSAAGIAVFAPPGGRGAKQP